jgi:hypothetical protein
MKLYPAFAGREVNMESDEQRALLASIQAAMNRPDPPKKLWIRPSSKTVIDHRSEHHVDYVLGNWDEISVEPARIREIIGRLPEDPADWRTDDIIDIEPDVLHSAMAVGWVRAGWDDEGMVFFHHNEVTKLVERAVGLYLEDFPDIAHEYEFRMAIGMESFVLEGTEIFDFADNGVIPISVRKVGP